MGEIPVSPTRILAIDPGQARLGLAVSDPDRKIASPLANYTRKSLEQDGQYLQGVIADEEIALVVVGLPVHLSGDEGEQAAKARVFGKWLNALTGIPCAFYDERFSTVEAESALWSAGLTHKKRKARRDRVAAQILLQSYLEAGCPLEDTPRNLR
ncbi:MAG: Holliday junction resolvase RuvX [Planctomycetes bacterium]|nr:Holliday junction resolvase RuvX [Planctomycetota bacterium]